MRLLLDTHALLWWSEGSERLSRRAVDLITDEENDVFVSAVSAMEIATKFRLNKLPGARRWALAFEAELEAEGFGALPIAINHARIAGGLPIPHKDPFDRLLIAQASIEGMTLVSNEVVFDSFGVNRFW